MDYHGAGVYHLSLPGGAVVPVEIGEGIAGAAALLCLGVLVLGIVFSCRQDRRLKELLRRGGLLGGEEALTKHVLQEETRKIQIRLVEGLPTSFLTSRGWLGSVEYVICLQRELSRSSEPWCCATSWSISGWGTSGSRGGPTWGISLLVGPADLAGLQIFLSGPGAGMRRGRSEGAGAGGTAGVRQDPGGDGAGRSLWSTPLCFGECDTAVRVKTAARPQRTGSLAGPLLADDGAALPLLPGRPHPGGLAEDALLTWERGGGTVDTLVAHTMDQVRQDLGLGPILALQVWCVAEDGEHVWVVMELREQGWVGAEYFWYPARDRLYFTHAEVLKKPPGSDGGGAAVMKAGSIVLWSCSLLMEAFLGLSLLRWTFRYERAWLVLQKGECSGGPGPGGLGPGQIAYARPAAMVTGRAYVEPRPAGVGKKYRSEARGLSTGGFMRQ